MKYKVKELKRGTWNGDSFFHYMVYTLSIVTDMSTGNIVFISAR